MMSYTSRSVAVAWLIILALFAVSLSGVARGGWFVLLLAAAMAVPMLVLRSPVAIAVATASPERPSLVVKKREGSPLDASGTDVLGWENEGGAGRSTRPAVREAFARRGPAATPHAS